MVAIDLGSNTLRVLEYDCARDIVTADFEKIVKTADKLGSTGVIYHEAVNRVIYAIKEAQEQIDFFGQKVVAVTTEALRCAKNSEDVLSRIAKETGVVFRIINGDEEARLTLLATKERLHKLHYASEKFVLADIGGGSTEIICHYPGEETVTQSFPVGIVTIAQQYETLDQIAEALPHEMLSIQKFIAEVYATRGECSAFVATAGTPTTVAAMKLGQTYATYDPVKINGTSLQKEEMDIYLAKLLAMPFEVREKTVGIGRSDLIAAGILIFKQLYMILEQDVCIVIDDGLREGITIDTCRSQ